MIRYFLINIMYELRKREADDTRIVVTRCT